MTIICVLLSAAGIAGAQSSARSVETSDICLTRTGDQVEVSFTVHAGKRSTPTSHNLVVNPVLSGGATKRQLPSIVIRGRRSKVTDLRHELATGERRYELKPVYMSVGESLDYNYTLPYEEWMRGGDLSLEGISVGCCSATEVELGLIAHNILYAEPVFETKIVATEIVVPRRTIGETLAAQYPFVAPMDELASVDSEPEPTTGINYDMPLTLVEGNGVPQQRSHLDRAQDMIASTRKGSISVFFRQGSHIIDRNFGVNNKNLVELISAVRALASAEDTRIVKIIIAGFASPEGSPGFNERLAWNRAVSVKDMLAANTGIDPRTIELYNGGVDWQGLRELVDKSDYYQRRQILDIIDNVPVWNPHTKRGRLGELMRIESGAVYVRMLRELFPHLRQAAYIKVYYENK